MKSEESKQMKLKTIATEKYNVNLKMIDNYMPKGKEFYEKVAALENKAVKDAARERKNIRIAMRSKSQVMDDTKKNVLSKAERLEMMKLRLQKKAKEAQALLDKAIKMGETEKIEALQSINI